MHACTSTSTIQYQHDVCGTESKRCCHALTTTSKNYTCFFSVAWLNRKEGTLSAVLARKSVPSFPLFTSQNRPRNTTSSYSSAASTATHGSDLSRGDYHTLLTDSFHQKEKVFLILQNEVDC